MEEMSIPYRGRVIITGSSTRLFQQPCSPEKHSLHPLHGAAPLQAQLRTAQPAPPSLGSSPGLRPKAQTCRDGGVISSFGEIYLPHGYTENPMITIAILLTLQVGQPRSAWIGYPGSSPSSQRKTDQKCLGILESFKTGIMPQECV